MSGDLYRELRSALLSEEPVVLATVTSVAGDAVGLTPLAAKLVVRADGRSHGTLGHPELDRIATRDALAALDRGVTVTRHYGPQGEARREEVAVFFEVFAPPARLIVFGAVDFTRALVEVGKVLGFAVTVCDARPVFATKARFPVADEVVVEWPDRYLDRIGAELGPRDAICVLTHDTEIRRPGDPRCAAHACRLSGCDGLTAHARAAVAAPRRGRRRRGRAEGAPHEPDRPRHRGPDA